MKVKTLMLNRHKNFTTNNSDDEDDDEDDEDNAADAPHDDGHEG